MPAIIQRAFKSKITINARNFCRSILPYGNSESWNIPILWVNVYPDRRSLLLEIFPQNPQLTQGMTAEALCRLLCPKNLNQAAPRPALGFYWLIGAADREAYNLLMRFLDILPPRGG